MGHCDSPAQFSRDSGVLGYKPGIAGPDPALRPFKPLTPSLNVDLGANRANDPSRSFTATLLLFFLQVYKMFLSPFFGGACKYHPSCSNYAREAIEVHGAARGTILAVKRLGRCRPFKPGGFDPVPSVEELSREKLRRIEVEPLR